MFVKSSINAKESLVKITGPIEHVGGDIYLVGSSNEFIEMAEQIQFPCRGIIKKRAISGLQCINIIGYNGKSKFKVETINHEHLELSANEGAFVLVEYELR